MEFGIATTLLYFTGIVLVLLGGMFGSAINQLMGVRVQRPRIQIKDQQDLPAHLQQLYQDAIAKLSELGFEEHHCQLSRDIISHEYSDKWTVVMLNRRSRIFAEISPASSFLDLPGYETDFWSIAKDGTALITLNGRGHTLLCNIPGAQLHDPLAISLTEQFEAHLEQQKVAFEDKPVVLLSASGYVKLQQKLLDAYFLNLMKQGGLVSTGQNEFRLTFSSAIKIVPRFIKGDRKVQKLLRQKLARGRKHPNDKDKDEAAHPATVQSGVPDADGYDVESEVQAYLRLSSARERNPAGLASKLIMFAVTLVLSYFAFGLAFSFNSVFILLGVILFHELGHIAAMYAFKYRDLQILFIPLLGAAATGKKDKVAVWKQVVVYLMGPLPGIVAGIGLIVLYQQHQWEWLYETAIIMLVINYLNLLPFVPLDGGHIVRLTIMERFPTGKLLFTGFSGLAFAAGGWFLGEPIFWVLATVMLVSLPWSALEAGVLNELYQQPLAFDDLDKNGKLAKLFETLKQPRFHKLHFIQKYDLVKSLSEVLLQQRHLGRLGTLGLAGIYISALLLTPPAIMVTSVGMENTVNIIALMSGKVPTKDWDAEIAEADSSLKRFDTMLKATQFYTATNDLPKALGYLEQAEAVFAAINTDSALSRLYEAYSLYYQRKQDLPKAESYVQKIIKLHRQSPERYKTQLANNYQALATLLLQQNKLDDLEEILKTGLTYALRIEEPEQRFVITTITSQLLDVYYRDQRLDIAQTLLTDMLPKLKQHQDPLNKHVIKYVYQELGWLSAKQDAVDSAMEYFNLAMVLQSGKSDPLNSVSTGKVIDSENNFDPMEITNVILAMAAVQYQKGNMSISQDYLKKAEQLVKNNYFESLEQYVNNYATEIPLEDGENTIHRETARWKLISETQQYFTPKKTAAAH